MICSEERGTAVEDGSTVEPGPGPRQFQRPFIQFIRAWMGYGGGKGEIARKERVEALG